MECFAIMLFEGWEIHEIMVSASHRKERISFIRERRFRICLNPDIYQTGIPVLVENEASYVVVVMAFSVISTFYCEYNSFFPVYCQSNARK